MPAEQSSAEGSLRTVHCALRDQRWAEAGEFAVHAIAEGLPVSLFKPAFDAAGKSELLLRAIWEQRDRLFNFVGTFGGFARIAAGSELATEYIAGLRQWALDHVAGSSSFGMHDYLLTYVDLDGPSLAALFCMKHGAWALDSSRDALEKAARFADRVTIPDETAEFFYGHRADREMQFSGWLRQFRITQMLYHLFCDVNIAARACGDSDPIIGDLAATFCRTSTLREYLDVGEAVRLFKGLDRSRGLLLSTFHGGFLRMSNFFFVTCMPDPFWVTGTGEEQSNVATAQGNKHAAAFRTYKALSQGKAVLIAPDGPHHGDASSFTVEVLGLKTKISEGGAMLAYESNCDTGWISAVRRGNVFVPEFFPGPRRLQGETYTAYRDRWMSFYAGQIERALSAGPENLVPIARWAKPFAKAWSRPEEFQ